MAEDDKLNQTLAKALLKKMGCKYDVVENGALVIEALGKSDYDLILMDIEMPEMDGYDTTIKIRSSLTAPICNIPIIAITADSSREGLKKCMEVGINDFIIKPIFLDALSSKIESVMLGINGNFNFPDASNNTTPKDEKVFSLKSLYTACGGNSVTVNNIISLFVKQSPENIIQLKQFTAVADWQSLKNLCHKMKAVYSLLGLSTVKTYLEEMEDACVTNTVNLSKFETAITEIERLNFDLIQEINKILSGEISLSE